MLADIPVSYDYEKTTAYEHASESEYQWCQMQPAGPRN